ncbi:hypothetical protein F2P81_019077 [Scophthalmus maximus]|uniref:Uncharacterized protein n=1 Tax=Scophthalmus maximus TaxID=52904 RepID=A0A6A4S8T3_SCOMX|nr:hypothetical protein F2P81_019077 [Scophthalmus maximus]
MAIIIISLAAERFSTVEKLGTKTPSMNNLRAKKISHIRQELWVLKWKYKGAQEEERDELAELGSILRKKLTILRRAEWHRGPGKKTAKRRSAFISNPRSHQAADGTETKRRPCLFQRGDPDADGI